MAAGDYYDDLETRSPEAREAARIVRQVLVERLIQLTGSGQASNDARAVALSRLKRIQHLIDAQQQTSKH